MVPTSLEYYTLKLTNLRQTQIIFNLEQQHFVNVIYDYSKQKKDQYVFTNDRTALKTCNSTYLDYGG